MELRPKHYLGHVNRTIERDGLTISVTQYPAAQRQRPHWHENPTFFLLFAGSFDDVSPSLGCVTPQPFELLFHPAGATHEGTAGPEGRLGWNLEPSAQWLVRNDLLPTDLGTYRVQRDERRAVEFLRAARDQFARPDSFWLEFLLPLAPGPAETSPWMRKLAAKLAESNDWTLSQLARELAVHPVHLARVFRARFGLSLSEFVRIRRVLEASARIPAGYRIGEAAQAAGFSDQSHFGRAFKELFDVSPRTFLSSVRGND